MSHETEWLLMGIAVAGAIAAIYATWVVFMKNKVMPAETEQQLKPWQKLIYNKYYVDEMYELLIRKPLDYLSVAFHKFLDLSVIDGIVNGVGNSVKAIGSSVRYFQTGNIGFYVMSMTMGVVLIILLTFLIK